MYSSHAQKKTFYKGYIIQHNGDTIQGLIKDRSPEPYVSLFNKVRFKKGGSSRTKKYGPEDILGYGYHGQNFISMPFREETQFFKFRYYADMDAPRKFLKVIRRSRGLVYLELLFVHDDNFYLDSIPFFYKPNSNQLVRVTQGFLGFKRKHLAEYFPDCQVLHHELYRRERVFENVSELYEFCLSNCSE